MRNGTVTAWAKAFSSEVTLCLRQPKVAQGRVRVRLENLPDPPGQKYGPEKPVGS